jgi:hypothetical protein
MKLLLCTECFDLFMLTLEPVACVCGSSIGQYGPDGLNAAYSGPCIPIGFSNSSFVRAIKEQPEEGMGRTFEAFVIPKTCPTMKKVDTWPPTTI